MRDLFEFVDIPFLLYFIQFCKFIIIYLGLQNSRRDEHVIAEETDGNVVVDDVTTFLGGSLGSVDKLLYVL